MKSGIYKITNIVNNKCYIGSSVNIKQRMTHHRNDLRKDIHENKYLQNAWNKYGEKNFKFSILLYCSRQDLIEREQQMIDYYKALYTRGGGYNICPKAGSCLGKKHNQKAKDKMKGNVNGRGNKGRITPISIKLKISVSHKGKTSGMKGKTHSKETKEKMRKAKLGKESPRKGCVLSEDTKKKMSLSHSGHKAGMTGKQHSEETKRKISINNGSRKRKDIIFQNNNPALLN